MTTRREFLVAGGALAIAGGLTATNCRHSNDLQKSTLVLRDSEVPRALLPKPGWQGSEVLFNGDYAAQVDLARRHFARGGTRMVAAIDTAGALLLVHALRGRPGLRVTEQSLPVGPTPYQFKLVVAATGSKA